MKVSFQSKDVIDAFISSNQETMTLVGLNKLERAMVHDYAAAVGLIHFSAGSRRTRALTLLKSPPVLFSGKWSTEHDSWVAPMVTPDKLETSPATPSTLSIAIFNVLFNSEVANPTPPETIRLFPSFADMTDHPLRRPYIMNMLREADADILALQEVTPDFYQDLLAQEWVREHYFAADVTPGSVTPSGNAFLSKYPISVAHHWKYRCSQKSIIYVRVDIGGKGICFGGVHLKAGKYYEKGRQRAQELAESISVLNIVRKDYDACLLGDFNFRDNEQERHPILEDNYSDTWKALYPDDPGFTHNPLTNSMGREQSIRTFMHRNPGAEVRDDFPHTGDRFDRIYLQSETWTPTKAGIFGTEPICKSECRKYDIYPSDHYGLKVTLGVNAHS